MCQADCGRIEVFSSDFFIASTTQGTNAVSLSLGFKYTTVFHMNFHDVERFGPAILAFKTGCPLHFNLRN